MLRARSRLLGGRSSNGAPGGLVIVVRRSDCCHKIIFLLFVLTLLFFLCFIQSRDAKSGHFAESDGEGFLQGRNIKDDDTASDRLELFEEGHENFEGIQLKKAQTDAKVDQRGDFYEVETVIGKDGPKSSLKGEALLSTRNASNADINLNHLSEVAEETLMSYDDTKLLQANLATKKNNKLDVETKGDSLSALDHVLGVLKIPMNKEETSSRLSNARKLGTRDELHRYVENDHILNTSELDPIGAKAIFSTDDEPINDRIKKELAELEDIEDALLLRRNKGFIKTRLSSISTKKRPHKNVFESGVHKKEKPKGYADLFNPMNNPLLQDPDTFGPSTLTKSDKAILKSLQRLNLVQDLLKEGKENLNKEKWKNKTTEEWNGDDIKVSTSAAEFKQGLRRKELSLPAGSSSKKQQHALPQKPSGKRRHRESDAILWGYFPGLDKGLPFSAFLSAFLKDRWCQLRVFMAWTTPPWSYTVRHQRGLESLLHFHPHACVVIFSETIELDFFKKFVQSGFHVAVVRPNLEELLEDTSAEVFSSIWLAWRKVELFYIHYTELLRLAALYKYGGIYLDTDVIVVKPLNTLQNCIASESVEGSRRLNGAVMVFQKSSAFLKDCLDEFTATYDDKHLTWNGADLLSRVAKKPIYDSGTRRTKMRNDFIILPPSSFFPFSASSIARYFYMPVNGIDMEHIVLDKIARETYAVHLYGSSTSAFVPQPGSLMDKIMNLYCIWCEEII